MIYPITYGGDAVGKDKDGNDVVKPIHPRIVLQLRGPVIQVTITQPTKVSELYAKQGKSVAAATVQALIDTGASGCIITDSLAAKLNLIQTGFQKITSVQDNQDRPKYFAKIMFPWNRSVDVSVASCPLKGIDCLIGRDILKHWNLIYSGVTGQITICD